MAEIENLSARYWDSFVVCGLICCAMLYVSKSKEDKSSGSNATSEKLARFSAFQTNYLFVFVLAKFADWMQGPYVYELYVSYGFNQQEIAELFVAGFASSMVVGTFVGGLADKLGRRFMCVVYCICYILACFTKLVPHYWTLMFGRFLSGVCTSLLHSSFESWMVCEHFKQGFDVHLLSETFAYATFGNGLGAVLAGLIANSAAEMYGFVAPFVVAILPLTLVAFTALTTWSENYGNQQQNMFASLSKGFDLVRNDSRLAALGFGQSCFEGAMYTFVFMWTPALKSVTEAQAEASGTALAGETTSSYLGLIFAVFMVCTMIGSSCFKLFSVRREWLYKIPLFLHATAFCAMAIVTIFLEHKIIVYSMFLVFEGTVGVFYPSYGVIKSEKIPEDVRSAVMNIFRIPLNAFVVLLLLKIKFLSSQVVFCICSLAHAVAFMCYWYFYSSTRTGDVSALAIGTDNEQERMVNKDNSA